MSKAERERKNKELQVLVSGYLIRSGYNKKELAVKLGMSTASLYNKLNDSDKFTFSEIRNLFNIRPPLIISPKNIKDMV